MQTPTGNILIFNTLRRIEYFQTALQMVFPLRIAAAHFALLEEISQAFVSERASHKSFAGFLLLHIFHHNWSRARCGRAIAQLSRCIIAPGPKRAVGFGGQRMPVAGSDFACAG